MISYSGSSVPAAGRALLCARAAEVRLGSRVSVDDIWRRATAVELIRPDGGVVTIDDTGLPMPVDGMKTKAASLDWEFMFASAVHQTPGMIKQHSLLPYASGRDLMSL